MQVTEKGQITIPKRLRDAAGISPGSRVSATLEGGKIVIQRTSVPMDDRRDALRAAARKVRASMDQPFRQMDSDAIIAFLRPPDNDVHP